MLFKASSSSFTIFKRDIRENLVWLFIVTFIILLLGSFSLYMTGITKADLSNNTIWELPMENANNKAALSVWSSATHGIANVVMSLAVVFLVYRLFYFLTTQKDSTLWCSLPVSRPRLFFIKYFSGVMLITLALLLDTLGLIAIFFTEPAHLELYFSIWFKQRILFYLLMLNFYTISVLSMTLSGTMQDAVLINISIQLIIPLVIFLALYFMRASGLGYTEDNLESVLRLIFATSPFGRQFLFKRLPYEFVFSSVSLVILYVITLFVFSHRPQEHSERRLGEWRPQGILNLVWTLLGGLVGGVLIEGSVSLQHILLFIIGFSIFATFAHVVYRYLIKAPIKKAVGPIITMVVTALLLIIGLDLYAELGPKDKLKDWPENEVKQVILADDLLGTEWLTNRIERFHFEREEDPDLITAFVRAYRDSDRIAERRGFIRNRNFTYGGNLKLTFVHNNGEERIVNITEATLSRMFQSIAKSDVYSPIFNIRVNKPLPGDRFILSFRLAAEKYDEIEKEYQEAKKILREYDCLTVLNEDDYFYTSMDYPVHSGIEVELDTEKALLLIRHLDSVAADGEGYVDDSSAEELRKQLDALGLPMAVDVEFLMMREIKVPGIMARDYSANYNSDKTPLKEVESIIALRHHYDWGSKYISELEYLVELIQEGNE